MDYVITMDDSKQYLSHHGVLGMRWGHRKANIHQATKAYNHEDEAYKKRYSSDIHAAKAKRADAFRKATTQDQKNQARIQYIQAKQKAKANQNGRDNASIKKYGAALSKNGMTASKAFVEAGILTLASMKVGDMAGKAVYAVTRSKGKAFAANFIAGSIAGIPGGIQMAKGGAILTDKYSKK